MTSGFSQMTMNAGGKQRYLKQNNCSRITYFG
jgi:hypothetical protein